jgi:hypothetical protein
MDDVARRPDPLRWPRIGIPDLAAALAVIGIAVSWVPARDPEFSRQPVWLAVALVGLYSFAMFAAWWMLRIARVAARRVLAHGRLCAQYERASAEARRLSDALDTASRTVELDESLLRSMPDLAPRDVDGTTRRRRMEAILYEVLRDCTELFGPWASRAMILRPDGDRLVPWVHYQVPPETLARSSFYIGTDPERRRGVAGEVFVQGVPRVVLIDRSGARAVPSDGAYLDFDEKRAYPPYEAFAAVPLLWEDDHGNRVALGVLCLDSALREAFASSDRINLLVAVGTRIASTIVLYEELERSTGD